MIIVHGLKVSTDPNLSLQNEGWWDAKRLDYLKFHHEVVLAINRLFSRGEWILIGSSALNGYLDISEQRLVTGVDVALSQKAAQEYLSDPRVLARKLNEEVQKRVKTDTLEFVKGSLELGVFEPVRSMPAGRVRLVAIIRGGHLTLRESAKCCSTLASKLGLLDGNPKLLHENFSPVYFELKIWSKDTTTLLDNSVVHHSISQSMEYQNFVTKTQSLPSLSVLVPPIETLVASKLNMIYQSSINQGLIRATPLTSHYAAKYGKPKVYAADIYDFVFSSKIAKLPQVKKELSLMITEPVNAMLDVTAHAFKKLASTHLYLELNALLPEKRRFDQNSWKELCERAVQTTKRIRES
ncbi:hypothetical protein B9Q02_01425 [Candidatus Marsarchaeota G1 archaeon BE_D]|uniref:Uncharacterized protein n=1 Tax=Candidatus Marsarchaeota G1 archaeon BE_D TaxID=1978156 RepID=A0A2R6AJV1_9ARCH|nr:MAG: hypothetical protein B9Q02_01425 [Candidatus Marsarchaeota G1 archaeon BE_D]